MQTQPISQLKISRAQKHYTDCHLCEHHCGSNRLRGDKGLCKAGPEARVFRHRVEYGEELELIPSHLFYLSGCDLRCKFCIAEENAFNPQIGTLLTTEFLEAALEEGKSQSPKNIQWVGGEPTIHIPAILNAMSNVTFQNSIVWKSDFYSSPEAFQLLQGFVDTYVADFKFGNNRCAKQIASINSYTEIISRNLKIARQQGDLIIRHLLLPGHFDCCYRPIVDWISKNIPETKFSIRDGYLPRWQARHDKELSSFLPVDAADLAVEYAEKCGLNVVI